MGGGGSLQNQAMGRSRGGANTKINALVDTRGRPLRLILSAGQRNDIWQPRIWWPARPGAPSWLTRPMTATGSRAVGKP